jgi:hypothetical protein
LEVKKRGESEEIGRKSGGFKAERWDHEDKSQLRTESYALHYVTRLRPTHVMVTTEPYCTPSKAR